MAPPYSNGYAYKGKPAASLPFQHNDGSFRARLRLVLDPVKRLLRTIWAFSQTRGRRLATNMFWQAVCQVRQNFTARRLFSFPHLLVCMWMLLLLWGERWAFRSRVADCRWSNWENWPSGANPHHLVLVADPQIIDPHSYPGRPWPLSDLTILITDNYLRRGYQQLQSQLRPDSVFFLGDLFDGGREWSTGQSDWKDADWAAARRPKNELAHVKEWNEKYRGDYWLSEYERFGDLYFNNWATLGGTKAGNWQRGRKLVASLPGNHDLGFGDQVKVSVRERFASYFGDVNRVDVIGNHSIVSVDTVSLSASSSNQAAVADLKPIHTPTDIFLKDVKFTKRKAVERELRFWRGDVEGVGYDHAVEDLETANVDNVPTIAPGEEGPDFPTILLTHVPLFREAGTPCGPYREHWPPAKPPKGQKGPVIPDHRNAISVSGGYQYQNVLSEEDSVKLVKSVGNIVQVFSGDDHDYCDIVHTPRKDSVREITVKSASMAMGVPTPGFLMVSLYNPVDSNGKPLPGAPEKTLQTHLCLLPNQLASYAKYVGFVFVTIVAISIRSFLVPVLNLTPFALEAEQPKSNAPILPTFKDKAEDDGTYNLRSTSATSGSRFLSNSSSRTRSGSLRANGPAPPLPPPKSKKKQGWGHRAPRIEIFQDDFYGSGKPRLTWKAASQRSRTTIGRAVREIGFSTWRVTWMAVLFWTYLAYKG